MATINLGKVITDQQKAVLDKQSYDSENSKLVITGDEYVNGDFTADSIIENMGTGIYRYAPFPDNVSKGIDVSYASVVKNGKKLTYCVAGTLTRNENTSYNVNICYLTFPSDVGEKLIPNSLNVLANLSVNFYANVNESKQLNIVVDKESDTSLIVGIRNTEKLTTGTPYSFRIEFTFLLSDNLAV